MIFEDWDFVIRVESRLFGIEVPQARHRKARHGNAGLRVRATESREDATPYTSHRDPRFSSAPHNHISGKLFGAGRPCRPLTGLGNIWGSLTRHFHAGLSHVVPAALDSHWSCVRLRVDGWSSPALAVTDWYPLFATDFRLEWTIWRLQRHRPNLNKASPNL